MDSFSHQRRARWASRLLALLFLPAAASIIISCHLVVMLTLGLFFQEHPPGAPLLQWDPVFFSMTAAFIGGLIVVASLGKTRALMSEGGAVVARDLGGRLIPRSTREPHEQQLIHVIDEMAITAGIPAVPVFALDDEAGINAFAAGSTPEDAVIAVTRGALSELSRDQLQALIGHEISHIIRGEMRLNFWMIGAIKGIFLGHVHSSHT